ncbi:MAG: histidine phosphatase family protein [Candidatus Paceibacterota bacterium]|jgi:broad specificity phosphatase PhoE
MAWPKLLVLVRHAESEGNVRTSAERAKYPVSTWEYPLTPHGEWQSGWAGDFVKREFGQFDVRYVSYYERSRQTMRIMFPHGKVYEDPRLAEAQRGIFHTLTNEEVAQRYPEEVRRKKLEGLYHYRPPGGENWPDVELRIHSFLGTLNRDCDDKKVIMVVHGNWLILFQRLIHHFSIKEAVRRYKNATFDNASVTWYESRIIRGQSRLILVGQNVVPWAGK